VKKDDEEVLSKVAVLLKSNNVAEPKAYTVVEMTRVAKERKSALIQCNKDKNSVFELLYGQMW
jgi:hypothetical protein